MTDESNVVSLLDATQERDARAFARAVSLGDSENVIRILEAVQRRTAMRRANRATDTEKGGG